MFSGSFGVLPIFLRRRFIVLHCQAFSSVPSHSSSNREAAERLKAYRDLENLDLRSAAKILFTTPPKRKKFGLDFHLVQLFFTCLPSLAVYLVAQYARSEIRRMEAEVEQKKKQAEEAERLKEAELDPIKEESNNELLEVKTRLDALEEVLKEIVDEKKRVIHSDPDSNKKDKNGKVESADKNSENPNDSKDFGNSSTIAVQNGRMQHRDANIAST
ncbi:hypothetical protein KSP39_PZI014993 [Platanthera zijinensis]|uniref:Uncharacterized protein n=1 Tax=Platanthera zijinensis TaxID=2320716 RepID=A0AAP0BC43_9ASPA